MLAILADRSAIAGLQGGAMSAAGARAGIGLLVGGSLRRSLHTGVMPVIVPKRTEVC